MIRSTKKARSGSESSGLARTVRKFYQEHPFPDFDLGDFPTFEHLKQRASPYVRRLNQSIGSRAIILEVGCGTGQLSNYLAHISTRQVIGIDFSHASLSLARKLRDQLGFHNLEFLQSDLFGLPLPEEHFDFVLCHGVLHHTPEPRRGLHLLSRMLKPGGGIVIGLYHRLGRRRHWRESRKISELWDDDSVRTLKYRPSKEPDNPRTISSWFTDMYLHPYESGHLLVETTAWFREIGLTVTASVPAFEWGAGIWSSRPFFEVRGISRWQRNRLTYLFNDLRWWIKPVERGYFLLFGRKE